MIDNNKKDENVEEFIPSESYEKVQAIYLMLI